MKQLTVRQIDPALAKRLRETARARGLSLNRTVLLLLRQAAGLARQEPEPPKAPVRHTDLDHLAGTWSEQEAQEFDEAVRELRQVDPELWR
ncbi:MAG: hypothetical protein HY660_08010 [Armatimonadetes bacterium]|nr:hypothetical protein [Armatimonadota bacterium]